MKNTLSIILSLTLLIGCENNGQALKEPPKELPKEPLKEVPETGFPKPVKVMPLATLNHPCNRKRMEKLYQVINDEDSWQRLLSKMGSDCLIPTRPSTWIEVDFSRFTVIAVFDGGLQDEGYPPVVITEICEHENYISVSLAMMIISRTFDIVKIPKTDKPVKFVLSGSDVKCGD